MKTKSKIAVVSVVSVLLGYALGTVIAWPGASGNLGNGDISQVSKFHKSVVSPQLSAYQEKLKNDSTELLKAVASLTVLSSRMSEFASLVDIAVEAASGQSELQSEVEALKSLKPLSQNAANAGSVAMASFDNLMYGSSNANGINYDQASQNLTLAYLMVGRQMQVGKEYVAAIDRFLRDKKADDYMDLSVSRDLWANYCAGEAILSKNKDEIRYWNESEAILPADGLADEIRVRGMAGLSAEYALDQQIIKSWEDLAIPYAEGNDYGIAGRDEFSAIYGISENMAADLRNSIEDLSIEKLNDIGVVIIGIGNAESYGIEDRPTYGILRNIKK